MKYTLFAVAFLFAFAGISTAHVSAAVVCDYPDHAVWNNDNSAKVGCITDVSWKASLASQTNLNDINDFVNVVRGQKLLTTFGYEDTCPTWFPMNCVIKKNLFVKFI